MKKITIANFYCHLHYINWSDKTIDYYWSDHPDIKTIAVPIEGSLKVFLLFCEIAFNFITFLIDLVGCCLC